MRDILLSADTPDLQSIHMALAREFLSAGQRRAYLFSPTLLPDGSFGAWVRIDGENESRGREVVIPKPEGESDFILRAFAAGKAPDRKKRAFPATPEFDAAREAWLARQGRAHGFAVVRSNFMVENAAVRRPAGAFGFNVTVYGGRLKVTDADKFQSAMQHGIGTRRGYGCGMLLLLPDPGQSVYSTNERKTP